MHKERLAIAVDYYRDDAEKNVLPEAVLKRLHFRSALTPDSSKLLLVMVGLPARGKSFISHKLLAFLAWSGSRTEIFNAGQHRRGRARADDSPDLSAHSRAEFFSKKNTSAHEMRNQIAMATLDELLEWFATAGGDIGIFDATNSTRERRRAVVDRAAEVGRAIGETISVVFIESICEDADVLEANMLAKVRASPDFDGMSEEEALDDLKSRVANYEAVYEPVSDEEGAYIKLYDISAKVSARHVFGRMSQRVLPYMMSLHIGLRPVFLAALPAGYSSSRLSASSEGDSSPTHGGAFAREISRWVRASVQGSSLRLLCSTQPSAVEAAQVIATESGCISPTHRSGLNPLDTGEEPRLGREARIASMGFSERHLGGESFADLVRRLEPCVLDIEASMEPVLILAHGTPCRALRAYFMRIPVVECMGAASSPAALALTNASNCVVELRPSISGRWTEHIHQLVTTPRPSNFSPIGLRPQAGPQPAIAC